MDPQFEDAGPCTIVGFLGQHAISDPIDVEHRGASIVVNKLLANRKLQPVLL